MKTESKKDEEEEKAMNVPKRRDYRGEKINRG